MAVSFKYKAINFTGKVISGKLTAPHKLAAINILRQKKLLVLEIKEVSVNDVALIKFLPATMVSTKELSLFCRQFATMTSSGIPLIQGLTILHEQTDNKAVIQAIKGLISNLETGKTLGESMANYPRVFPKIFVNMIEAGELSGSLDQILDRLAIYFENYYELTEKIKSAITYPMFILLIAFATIAAILILVLPTFTSIIINMKAPVSFPTTFIIEASNILRNYWYLNIVVIGSLIIGYKKLISTCGGKKIIDQISLQLPVYGQLIKQINTVRFSRTLSILLSSGVPLVTSLSIIKKQDQNYKFYQAINNAEISLKEGNDLATPLQSGLVFPPMVVRMVKIGEETGRLDIVLDKIAGFYEKEVYQTVNRLSALLEPILICLIGGIVGFIMISILLPIFSVMDSLQ